MKRIVPLLIALAIAGDCAGQEWLKQSTAVDRPVGPFLDAGDGVTPETTLTVTQPDVRLKKGGGAWAQKSAAQTLSHEEGGWYEVSLSATDTDTLGPLELSIQESGAAPVWHKYIVVPANVYDSLVAGTDVLQGDVTQVEGGDATTYFEELSVQVGSFSNPAADQIKAQLADAMDDQGYTIARAAFLDIAISSRLAPTVAARTLDIDATGNAGIDWANVSAPTTTLGLTNTTVGRVTLTDSTTDFTGTVAQVDNTELVEERIITLARRADGTTVGTKTIVMRVDEELPYWIDTTPVAGGRWLSDVTTAASSSPAALVVDDFGMNRELAVVWLNSNDAVAGTTYSVTANCRFPTGQVVQAKIYVKVVAD